MYCNQCGKRIDSDSAFCRYCGSPQSPDTSAPTVESATTDVEPEIAPQPENGDHSHLTKILLGGIAVIAVVVVLIPALSDRKDATPRSSALDNIAAELENGADQLEAEAATAMGRSTPAAVANWSYSTDEDKIRGKTTYFASTISTNSIRQGFPYDAETTMEITVRKSPAYGTDVILTISSGQMMCSSYDGCSGTVRFDDGPAQHISFNGSSDNSSEVVFLVGAQSFITKMKKARRIVIEKTLYQAGAPQFEFNVEGLKWEH